MKKQNIIFFVGPDRCGKTTLSYELSKQLGIRRFNASKEYLDLVKNQDENFHNLNFKYSDLTQLDMIEQLHLDVIFDRGFPCEYAYSKYFNREINEEVLTYLDESYAALGAKIVCCTRQNFSGVQDDVNPLLTSQALEKIDQNYFDFLYNHSKCKFETFYVDDYRITNFKDHMANIIKFVKS